MYESAFGITAPPFQLTPDPSFYFDSGNHRRALTTLRDCAFGEQGLIVVTGDTGVGKTTLVRALLCEIDPASIAVANIVSSQLDSDDLFSAAAIAFGVASVCDGTSRPENVADDLLSVLRALAKEGRRGVLIIDEAQNVPAAALDRLLGFLTQQVPRDVGLQVWLVGQPELRATLEAADSTALRWFVLATCHVGPLSPEETGAYIEHRLARVGWNGSPRFEPGAFEAIFRWTQGVPRRINQLCNRILMARSVDPRMAIDAASVERLASELRAEIGVEGEVLPIAAAKAILLDDVAPVSPSAASAVKTGDRGRRVDLEIEVGSRTPASAFAAAEPPKTLLCVAADYGDHVKAGALIRALAARAASGQPGTPSPTLLRVHDNDALANCGRLYAELEATRRTVDLNVPEGSHDAIVVELMAAFAATVEKVRPSAVVVFDGSPTAFACSTVARAKRVPVVHIGAGLRLNERFVAPAAIRKLTDHTADLLFTTDAQASRTLNEEGVPAERVHCVGSLAVDALRFAITLCGPRPRVFKNRHGYAMVLLNHPANIEGRDPLGQLTDMLSEVSRVIPIVWLLRSRLHSQLKKYHLGVYLPKDRVRRFPAQPYVDYVALLRGATCVLTDSWNVQEEASALDIPCLAIGAFPERAIAEGSNVAVGLSRTRAVSAVWEYVLSGAATGRAPPLWDGRTGDRIAGYLAAWNLAAATIQ